MTELQVRHTDHDNPSLQALTFRKTKFFSDSSTNYIFRNTNWIIYFSCSKYTAFKSEIEHFHFRV